MSYLFPEIVDRVTLTLTSMWIHENRDEAEVYVNDLIAKCQRSGLVVSVSISENNSTVTIIGVRGE